MDKGKFEHSSFWSSAFDNMDDFIFILDNDFNIVRVNKSFLKFTGKKEKYFLGRKCYKVVHALDKPVPECPYRKTMGTKKFEVSEFYDNNLKRWLYVRTTPIFNSNNELIGSIHLAADVTERRRREELLKEERDFSNSLINTAQAVILVLDKEGRIVSFNPYMEKLSGYRLEKIKGKDWFSTFLPENGRDRIRGIFKKSIEGNQIKGEINPIVTKREWNRHHTPLRD